ncbi:Elongator subunit elp4 [Gonapodya sp. JEL0774]|nr:Elongator subunit elp4 [Gonapodya sp. JEL0774]
MISNGPKLNLDQLFGGGIPLGSVTILLEDRLTSYADRALACFVTQGLVSQHSVFVAGGDVSEFLHDLPAVWVGSKKGGEDRHVRTELPEADDDKPPQSDAASDVMSIAWRYSSLPTFSTHLGNSTDQLKVPSITNKRVGFSAVSDKQISPGVEDEPGYRTVFDFAKRFSPEELLKAEGRISRLEISSLGTTSKSGGVDTVSDPFQAVLSNLAHLAPTISGTSSTPIAPLRIAIRSLCDPSWLSALQVSASLDHTQMTAVVYRFLHSLRLLLRARHAAAVVTIPSYLHGDGQIGGNRSWAVRRWESVADAVVEFESFEGGYERTHFKNS